MTGTNRSTELSPETRTKIGRNAGIVGIGVNIALFAVKLTVGVLSGSVSVIADAVNNLTDAGSSVLVILGYAISAKPADHEHPYGHARMEYLCGLFISVIITFLGAELFKTSIETILDHEAVAAYSAVSLCVMLVSAAVKVFLALFYRRIGKRIDSQVLRASATDSIGDVCATSAVIVGILLTPMLGAVSDGIFGCLVAVYIFVMGVKLIIESSNTLIGAAPDVELVKKMIAKLRPYEGVLGIHDLVIHNYGAARYFGSVHIEMDAEQSILECHDVIDRIENDFRRDMGIDLVIHLDPVTLNDERINELRSTVRGVVDELAAEFSSPVSFHDLRVVFGTNTTELRFDLAIGHDFPLSNEELVEMLRSDIRAKLGDSYTASVTVDRDYTTERYDVH